MFKCMIHDLRKSFERRTRKVTRKSLEMSSGTAFFLIFFASVSTVKATTCFTDSDCYNNYNYNDVCCNGFCQDQYNYCSCYGGSSMDCPDNKLCCDGSCEYDCGLDPGAVAGIIVGSIFSVIVVVFIGLCLCGICCAAGPFRNRGRRGGYVRGPAYGTTTTTVVSSTAGAPNPGYSQYPPSMGQPQYQQPPTAYPPPPQPCQNYASGYQSFPANQAPPPPYSQGQTEYLQKQPDYAPPPAVNPNV